jgi:succinylglutamate desuccinylase
MTALEANMLVTHIQKLEKENQELKSQVIDFKSITRFELINHTGGDISVIQKQGRVLVLFPCPVVEASVQDENKTLKIFLTK